MTPTTIDYTLPVMYRLSDAEPIRNATAEELEASAAAGDTGAIEVDGEIVYVIE